MNFKKKNFLHGHNSSSSLQLEGRVELAGKLLQGDTVVMAVLKGHKGSSSLQLEVWGMSAVGVAARGSPLPLPLPLAHIHSSSHTW